MIKGMTKKAVVRERTVRKLRPFVRKTLELSAKEIKQQHDRQKEQCVPYQPLTVLLDEVVKVFGESLRALDSLKQMMSLAAG